MFVYMITNRISGKAYVGQTVSTVAYRFGRHVAAATSKSRKRSPLHDAIVAYGAQSFTVECLETCTTQSELNVAECKWMAKMNTMVPNGYNLREGGAHGRYGTRRGGWKMTPEQREAHRRRVKARFADPVYLEKHRKLVCEKNRGRKPSPAALAALARGHIASAVSGRLRVGIKRSSAKLTDDQVEAIRVAYASGQHSQRMLACQYGVGQMTVSQVVRGKTWRHVGGPIQESGGRRNSPNEKRGSDKPIARLTEQQALDIRTLYASGNYSQKVLAARYGVGQMTISWIVRRVTWTHVGGPQACSDRRGEHANETDHPQR